MILVVVAVAIVTAITFVAVKAHRWDYATVLFNAQKDERVRAVAVVASTLRYFNKLAGSSTGLLTEHHLDAVDDLACSESVKADIRFAIEHAGPKVVIAENPWFLARHHSYELTSVGHEIGKRPEQRVYASRHSTHVYTVDVPVYGISKADLRMYVTRVKRRQTLANTVNETR